jgi:hypothetical protein
MIYKFNSGVCSRMLYARSPAALPELSVSIARLVRIEPVNDAPGTLDAIPR